MTDQITDPFKAEPFDVTGPEIDAVENDLRSSGITVPPRLEIAKIIRSRRGMVVKQAERIAFADVVIDRLVERGLIKPQAAAVSDNGELKAALLKGAIDPTKTALDKLVVEGEVGAGI